MKPIPFLLLACAACAAPAELPVGLPEPAVDLGPARELLWQGREDEALLWLDESGWSLQGSVAAERLRQDLLLSRGERPLLAAELAEAEALGGADPDLLYLRARIISDPEQRLAQLIEGAQRAPQHPWLGLGVAATLQEFGRWEEAAEWIDATPGAAATSSFRRLLTARHQAETGRLFGAWRLLERDAFVHGHREALLECLRLGEQLGSDRRVARAATELALRSAPAARDPGAAMDRVFERLVAEEPWMHGANLDATLLRIDAWAEVAGVPSGWREQARYGVAGLAEMVQPESFRGGVAAAWMEHGRFLLIGRAPGRGVDWLLLQDAKRLLLPLPNGLPAVEMIVAERGLEPQSRTIPGGAPFHGFFVRADLVRAAARARERELERFGTGRLHDEDAAEPLASDGPLEPWDLAHRLRARRIAAGGATAQDLEFVQLVLHECSHLPETLPWARTGVPLLTMAPAVIRSLLRFDDPVLFLEERAQLRALASGVEWEWVLAEILDRAHTPRDPYYAPYRSLLRALVERAQDQGFPPLHAWDELDADAVPRLAREYLAARGLEPMPRELAAAALRALQSSQAFQQLPAEHLAARLLDDR
jgi:hypothetical protein